MFTFQRKSIHEKYIPLYNAELYLSTLVIKNVQKSDSYEYKCSVENLSSKMNVIILDGELCGTIVFIYCIYSYILFQRKYLVIMYLFRIL